MISLLLILLSFGGLAPREQPENDDLRLTLRITGIKGYCASEPDFHQLHLRLELIFTNGSSRVLIIQKSLLDEITYWRTAETERDLKTAFWAHALWVTSGSGDVTDTGGAPDETYAVLKPGRTYKVRADLSLFSKKPLDGEERFLEIKVPTRSGTKQQAEKLQKKWEKRGVLWFKSIKSEPLSFMLDKATKVKRCS